MPTFNYDAARRAGYSEKEIDDYINQRRQAGIGITVNRNNPPKSSFLEKVADFLGVREFGRGLGQAAAQLSGDVRGAQESQQQLAAINENLLQRALSKPIGDPQRTNLLRQALGTSQQQSQQAQESTQDLVSNRQFLGSAATTALTVGSAGLVGRGKFGVDLVMGSGLGAGFGLADAVQDEHATVIDAIGRASTGALVGALFPSLGAAKRGLGRLLGTTGKKIGTTVIRPNASDLADGFKIDNVYKHKLGGSLQQTLSKTQEKLGGLTKELNETLTSTDAKTVDLAKVADRTRRFFLGGKQRLQGFGETGSTKRVLDNLKTEIDTLFPNEQAVNLYDATLVKRGAGTKGAWVFGSADPDATATQKVYTKFYQFLKDEIERNAPPELGQINRQISELIPIERAVIRRIPVAERNNLLSLTDNIGLFASVFEPRALFILGGKMLSTSGRVANVLQSIGRKLESETGTHSLLRKNMTLPENPSEVVKKKSFERAVGLTSEDRALESKAFDKIARNEKELLSQYKEKHGKIVNADNFRPLFSEEGYVGSNSAAVQEPSSYLAKKAFTENLKNPGKYATFTAGGSGTGKSSALNGLPEYSRIKSESAVVLDSNLSNLSSAIKKINQSQEAGKKPVIFYVYRRVKDSFVNGVVKRMIQNPEEGGRIVPTKIIAQNHIGSLEIAKKLSGDVRVFVVDNSLGAGRAKKSTIDAIIKKANYPSVEKLTAELNQEAQKLYRAGKITKEQYEAYVR